MDSRQLSILNSLVTFAAENIPGGLNEGEREVAKIVGAAALMGNIPEGLPPKYEYKVINATYYKSVEEACTAWTEQGWRLVSVVSDTRPGYAHALFERPAKETE